MATERLKSPRARMFVALDLPDQFVDRAVAWQQEAFGARRDLRLIPRYSLHVLPAFVEAMKPTLSEVLPDG